MPPLPLQHELPERDGCDVLLVEDNSDAAQALAVIFQYQGHRVHVAEDGEQALQLAASCAPALVLIDMSLPGIDGIEVTRRLRATGTVTGATIIGMSGYLDDERIAAWRRAGCDETLPKPLCMDELLNIVRSRLPKRTASGSAGEMARADGHGLCISTHRP